MKTPHIVRFALPATVMSLLLGGVACNEKDDSGDPGAYSDVTTVSIKSFKLQGDSEVLPGLDSVFFSIDLEHGVIFNADSLPAGTPVTDLIPVITYASTVDSAFITMENGLKRTGVTDYAAHPSDTIDFSGKVSLRLVARDGKTSRTYRLKVNVHKMESDTLMWDDMAAGKLPSRLESPLAQKSVSHDDAIYTLVRENDGTLTMATSERPASGAWTKDELTEGKPLDISTFTSTDDSFYILADDGELLKSDDALQWTSTGEVWNNIVGGFGNAALGIAVRGGVPSHVSYPAVYPEVELEPGFPVRGFSNMGVFSNKWSVDPIGIVAGGLDIDGNNVNAVWAFDGSNWAKLHTGAVGSLQQSCLIPYYSYRATGDNRGVEEYQVWLLTGGTDAAGKLNRTVYLSYDNGVNWQVAVDYMQLPDYIPGLRGADAIVLATGKSADLSDAWTRMPARRVSPWFIKSELDGYILSWECPFIYIFGGIDAESRLNTTIWRGVLNRLIFTPLI